MVDWSYEGEGAGEVYRANIIDGIKKYEVWYVCTRYGILWCLEFSGME